jgi:ABC-type amino acid transport substrate-binding protein
MATLPAGVSVPLVRPGLLTVCAMLGGLPYDAQDALAENKAEGFDMDVLALVAKRFGAPELVIQTDVRSFLTGQALNAHRCDLVAGSLSAGPDTAALFDATDPYFKTGFALLAPAGSTYRSLEALQGKRVAVVPDSQVADYLAAFNTKHGNRIQVTPAPDAVLIPEMVKGGRAEAALLDSGVAHYNAMKDSRLHVTADLGPEQDVVFGVRPGNTALRDQVNVALADAGRNRQYARAYAHWFGRQPAWVPGG